MRVMVCVPGCCSCAEATRGIHEASRAAGVVHGRGAHAGCGILACWWMFCVWVRLARMPARRSRASTPSVCSSYPVPSRVACPPGLPADKNPIDSIVKGHFIPVFGHGHAVRGGTPGEFNLYIYAMSWKAEW